MNGPTYDRLTLPRVCEAFMASFSDMWIRAAKRNSNIVRPENSDAIKLISDYIYFDESTIDGVVTYSTFTHSCNEIIFVYGDVDIPNKDIYFFHRNVYSGLISHYIFPDNICNTKLDGIINLLLPTTFDGMINSSTILAIIMTIIRGNPDVFAPYLNHMDTIIKDSNLVDRFDQFVNKYGDYTLDNLCREITYNSELRRLSYCIADYISTKHES